ncbi:hypothetical protein CAL29_21990 [Bordetella genomosp. 10]|uniref:HTH lysR-type domain-containing protein n=1 Tax=Bordetella genomosp. 10 TaxID=1416804 RepID=A0A261S003_9BORD|nr:LysR family transcriptional regulator [Bordetella genomosp. 10]OZI30669.1 hypothetical protein CAL29_21990 [Bordetella genomosp. 10]
MPRSLTLKELEAFACLAEHLNYKVAAQHVFVSQPALTRIIQTAEQKLDVRLFDRNTRRVELAPSGRELLPIARRLLSEFHDALHDLSGFIGGRRGNISVACLPSAAAGLLPPVMAELQQTHPLVTIALHPSSGHLLPRLLKEGTADFAISGRPTDSVLSYEPLLSDPLVLMCSAKDPGPASSKSLWDFITKRPLISSGSASSIRQVVDRLMEGKHIAVNARYEVANISVLGAMVSAGLGISIVPTMALRLMDTSQVATHPLDLPGASREIGILTRNGRTLSSASQHFLNCLRREALRRSATTTRSRR